MKHNQKIKNILIGASLLFSLCILLLYTLSVGAVTLPYTRILMIIWGKITVNTELLAQFKPNEIAVIWEIRLPRILCGIFVGSGLAVSGAIFQNILRNPLADPYTLGVSTGAAFGAAIAILLNVFWQIMLPVTGVSMLFAFLTLLAVIFIAQKGGGFASQNLIISGIIIGSILSSGISFLKMYAGENVSAIIFWLMGSLSSRHWDDIWTVAPIVLFCSTIAYFWGRDLDVMLLGDDNAKSLGVNTNKIRLLYLILGACMTAACVSVSGVIGFIGLVIPHMLRFRLAPQSRVLIPLSALSGALVLCLADNATRLLFSGEIPVGVLTTLIGGPFFIYIFIRREKYEP